MQYPLSAAQQRLWILHQLEPDSPAYIVSIAFRLRGELDVAALSRALEQVVTRHEILRTRFPVAAGRPLQEILDDAEVSLEVADLGAGEEWILRERLRAEARRPFDLSQGPTTRATLFRLGETEHVLLLAFPHLVIDGWSVGILLEELGELYSASVSGRPSALPPAVQYRDFAAWQNERLESELVSRELEYWRRQLDGVRSLRLPTDHPRPPRPSSDGRHHSFKLSPQALAALERLAREAGMTLHMLAVAAVGTLLHRYSGQDDFCIGIPKATRPQSRFERVLGFFINTLVLRLRLEDDPSFEELLARVRRSALEAYDHATVPFEWIVDDQHATRDLARTPFFDVMVTTREGRPVELVLPGLIVTPERIDSGVTQFDLTFAFERLRDGLSCGITYRAELFDPPTLERYESDFLTLFSVVASRPEIRPSELPVVETRERDRASTSTPAPRELVLADAPVRSGAAGLGGGAPPAVATFELEETIAAIWADVLEFESVGRHDNFFDLGGNSLLLIDAYSRLREVVGRELKVIDLFEHPTVSALARHLAQASKD